MSEVKVPPRGDEPAFPCGYVGQVEGMTLREYLAGQALAGYCENDARAVVPERAAYWAARCADALLDELERTKKGDL